ncbi:hypothetical protein C8E01_101245 [Pontibacter virosus]|uniref:Uncharacterized protein n=2 Tax=Pontibacter virosus TaxID=1765052 RepID=A0A2U1B5H0_9BACT|nr:hypothetical protein C8E01_101245 [Pontibacter virosus]
MGMLLMVIGVLCFITGFVFYSKSQNATDTANQFVEKDSAIYPSKDTDYPSIEVDDVPPSSSIAGTDNTLSSSNSSNSSPNSNELARVVDMAIADGVLTPNERSLIKEIANSNDLDYNAIIQDVEKRIAESGTSETEIIDVNKRSGDNFEKYVVQKFSNKYYRIKEWAGDKYVKGTYAETTQNPDLLIELKSPVTEFSVECKWKSNLFKGGVEFASLEQLKRYKDFEKTRKIPVFIAIGLGGTGENPEQLFILPLNKVTSNFIHINELKNFKKDISKKFYFHAESNSLR